MCTVQTHNIMHEWLIQYSWSCPIAHSSAQLNVLSHEPIQVHVLRTLHPDPSNDIHVLSPCLTLGLVSWEGHVGKPALTLVQTVCRPVLWHSPSYLSSRPNFVLGSTEPISQKLINGSGGNQFICKWFRRVPICLYPFNGLKGCSSWTRLMTLPYCLFSAEQKCSRSWIVRKSKLKLAKEV